MLESNIKAESKKEKKAQAIEVLDKTELNSLNQGAEDTSSSTEEENEDNPPKMRSISSSMQRSIDRLLKASFEEKKNNLSDGQRGKIIDENGKIHFDRLIYDLDTYRTIMERLDGFDYRSVKVDKKSQNIMQSLSSNDFA